MDEQEQRQIAFEVIEPFRPHSGIAGQRQNIKQRLHHQVPLRAEVLRKEKAWHEADGGVLDLPGHLLDE